MYCLMGIFGVNIPLIYGEGPRAVHRLQEIMKIHEDYIIFAWIKPLASLPCHFNIWRSSCHANDLLAESPTNFQP